MTQTDEPLIPTPTEPDPHSAVSIRPPRLEDGRRVLRLVEESQVLDPNSAYCYLLMAYHFGATSVVAQAQDDIVGFVYAYLPPQRARTVFVWQVGVAASHRGSGLGTRLLAAVLQRDACRNVRYLEATVGPTNAASLALFRGMGERFGGQTVEEPCFAAELFPERQHEAEHLLRIGPFDRERLDRPI